MTGAERVRYEIRRSGAQYYVYDTKNGSAAKLLDDAICVAMTFDQAADALSELRLLDRPRAAA